MGRFAELEPHPGGRYRVEVIPGRIARGEFVELDAPRRLVYTWGWEPGTTISSGSSPRSQAGTPAWTHG